MKKGTLTLQKLEARFSDIIDFDHGLGNLVGFIGKIPVRSNKLVPKGELWIFNEREFKKIK